MCSIGLLCLFACADVNCFVCVRMSLICMYSNYMIYNVRLIHYSAMLDGRHAAQHSVDK